MCIRKVIVEGPGGFQVHGEGLLPGVSVVVSEGEGGFDRGFWRVGDLEGGRVVVRAHVEEWLLHEVTFPDDNHKIDPDCDRFQ